MEVRVRTVVDTAAAAVHGLVRDLGTYPSWLGIVQRAAPVADGAEDPLAGPAWSVDVGAHLGPVRLAKRLRMVRVAEEPGRLVRFERHEVDGQAHPPWVLEVALATTGASRTELTVNLRYGGRRWLPGIERVVRDEARRAGPRLAALLGEPPRPGLR